mmetsp:Transcript_27567/g.30695  ORF Transcript_27567/g.30695 Transcript_27567/m.30695 type:complete len:295 (+) Transcript_27567:3-887(+)
MAQSRRSLGDEDSYWSISESEDEVKEKKAIKDVKKATTRVNTKETRVKLPILAVHTPKDVTVKLNVGGRKYQTKTSTLTMYPNSLLARMFCNENLASITQPNSDGEYFIDRNGRYFEYILDFYRIGKMIVPTTVPTEALQEEIDFFQLPISVDELQSYPRGVRYSKMAFRKACELCGEKFKGLVEVIRACTFNAAKNGCFQCKIDFMKSHAYKRAVAGQQHGGGIWQANVIDLWAVEFLQDDQNQRILKRYLERDGYDFILQQPVLALFSLSILFFGEREVKRTVVKGPKKGVN